MRYGSVCSGIEAASAAWLPLGWESAWLSEIEPFPCAVLDHHYPDTPNLGDITVGDFVERSRAAGPVDVIIGGTPCQSFSVAGLGGGIEDSRGNLALRFMQLVDALRPRIVVWENVPGVLSSGGGRDFGAILGALVECGYGWAYRILDAQHFGVAQRRRRVFIVGCLGSWAAAAEILSLRESLQGHPAPRREAGEGVAASLTKGAESGGRGGYAGRRREDDVNLVAGAITARKGQNVGMSNDDLDAGHLVTALRTNPYRDHDSDEGGLIPVAHALSAEGHDASEDGTGRGTPLVAFQQQGTNVSTDEHISGTVRSGNAHVTGGAPCIAFDTTQITHPENRSNPQPGDPCHPLAEGGHAPAVAYRTSGNNGVREQGDKTAALNCNTDQTQQILAVAFQEAQTGVREYAKAGSLRANGPGHDPVGTRIREGMAVRRLTPRECERLQGFPDDYTDVPYRNKPAADGPRYRALGNSMAVPVVRWIGERIGLLS